MKNKTTSPKTAAIVTIYSPGQMHRKGRKQIAEWLTQTAADLVEFGNQYTTGRFTARYIVNSKPQPSKLAPR